jgi:methyl coenzyme M reductase subunit D
MESISTMFANDITLSDGTNSHVYSLVSLQDSKATRAVAASGLTTPKTMVISHTSSGSGVNAVDRHLVRLNEAALGSDNVTVKTGSIYIVIEKPRQIVTDAAVQDLLDELVGFMTPSNLAKLLNSEP